MIIAGLTSWTLDSVHELQLQLRKGDYTMFIEELKKEYKRLVVIEMSMLKRRIALENAWSDFRAELEKAETDSAVSDEEMARLYDKNDKFSYVCDIARDREYNIGLLLNSMAEVIDRYDWEKKI